MPFDLNAAMRVAGNTPDMYGDQLQATQDLRERAKSDPEFRRRMATERARDWYRSQMGKEPPAIPDMTPAAIPDAPAPNQISPAGDDGQAIRGLLAELRQAGVIA